jgi:DNA-binding response OmpR family regulator
MAPGSRGGVDHPSASATAGDGRNGLNAPVELTFSFGPFRLSPRRQLLLKGDTPVPLGSRAFEILLALVERAGEVVDKNSLMTRA